MPVVVAAILIGWSLGVSHFWARTSKAVTVQFFIMNRV